MVNSRPFLSYKRRVLLVVVEVAKVAPVVGALVVVRYSIL